MKRALVFAALAAASFAVGAQPASDVCTITSNALIVDMRDPNCFPRFDEATCSHYSNVPLAKTVGASSADVASAKAHGVQVMKFAQSKACEGKPNCGFYKAEFASAATCAGAPVQDMPGGEYRGLTAEAARSVQEFANRQGEAGAKEGKDRGDKAKNPKHKGKLWGAPD